jgi:hypothetical protein
VPTFEPSADVRLHHLVDDFTEPWLTPDTILPLHGNAEAARRGTRGCRSWRAVPGVRPDMRLWRIDADARDFCLDARRHHR